MHKTSFNPGWSLELSGEFLRSIRRRVYHQRSVSANHWSFDFFIFDTPLFNCQKATVACNTGRLNVWINCISMYSIVVLRSPIPKIGNIRSATASWHMRMSVQPFTELTKFPSHTDRCHSLKTLGKPHGPALSQFANLIHWRIPCSGGSEELGSSTS